ncbi:hypothetical protein JYK02_38270 [Corallococcus macrosporus]|uniref:JmjC domain-containing protein n=1 Tax=Corallococcus macrosporus TaxID=35 RepID=A0ABS3DPW1_9BACT|nr:cupin domain-containing protein [Corallococcus macrosporus]MBN8233380.1 hypothetical protein [Corallococcus macrosporus]
MSHCENLQAVLSPTPLEQFASDIWERNALVVRRDAPDYFRSLFCSAELDGLINASFTNNSIHLIQGTQFAAAWPRRPRKTTLSEFYKEFSDGKSLALREMHVRWKPITRLVSAIARQSGFVITADLIAAPPRSCNAGAWNDSRSFFVLQLEGTSTWRLPPGRFKPLPPEEGGGESLSLKAGDTLYLPFANLPGGASSSDALPMVETQDSHSLHLVFTVQRVTYADLLGRAVAAASVKDIELRRAMGFGGPLRPSGKAKSEPWFRELAAKTFEVPDWEGALQALKREHRKRLPFLPDGHFELLRHVESVDATTVVKRRPGIEVQAHLFEGQTELIFPGYYYHGPEKLLLALDFISATPQFAVKDIPGWYTDPERVRLVKHLISMGILTFATSPAAKSEVRPESA